MAEFCAGNALENRELWLKDLNFLKSQQFIIPDFAWRAVETQSINLLENEYCWRTKRNISFNNKQYRNFDDLVEEYRRKSESEINYAGCQKNQEQFHKIMNKYLELGIIKYATPEEEKTVIINPLNCEETRPGKYSIILHTLINSMYRKMSISLMDVCHRGNILKDLEKLRSEDLVSCYGEVFAKSRYILLKKPKFYTMGK